VNFVASQDIISTVMSTSYDFIEANLPPALMQKVCNAYAALGAQGTSLFFASGDGGVSGPGNPVDNTCTDFVPTFPSTCPL
jgi:tripeptidyl-peptidase-1